MAAARLVGLLTPVSDFPQGLVEDLGLLLDKENELSGRDWRLLVKYLGLDTSEKDLIRQKDAKTETALKLWLDAEPNANGRMLVIALLEMRHNRAARIVQCYLGEEITDAAKLDLKEKLVRAAQFGYVSEIKESLAMLKEEAQGKSIEEIFSNWAYTPLHSAARFGHLLAVKELVKGGFDVRRLNYSKDTPADVARENHHDAVADYLKNTQAEVDLPSPVEVTLNRSRVDQLVESGDLHKLEEALKDEADPNAKGIDDWSALHTAAGRGDLNAAKLLVQYNADILARNFEGFTPEDWAKRCRHSEVAGYLKGVRIKLEKEKGPDADVIDEIITVTLANSDDDPIDFAIISPNLPDTLNEISQELGCRIVRLVAKENSDVVINNVSQLRTIHDVIAIPDDSRSLTPPNSGPIKLLNVVEKDLKAKPNWPRVLIHSINDYWSNPISFAFPPYEDWNVILEQATNSVGFKVSSLLTWKKLSKIKTGAILRQNKRVVAAGPKARTSYTRNHILDPHPIGKIGEKEVTRDGAFILCWDHGVIVDVPAGAVADGDKVIITVRVSLPSFRLDIGDDEWERRELQPAGHPVEITTRPPNYEFRKAIRIRLPHCGDVEENRNEPSIVVLTSPSSRDPHDGVRTLCRLDEEYVQDVRIGYVWLHVNAASWFWAFVHTAVACRQCTVVLYSHSDDEIARNDETEFRMVIVPGIRFYLSTSNPYLKRDLHDLTYRGSMNVIVPHGREIDIKASCPDEDWRVNPERQILSFQNVWKCLFDHSDEYRSFTVVTFRVSWAGIKEEKNASPLTIKFEINEAEKALVSCANLPNKKMKSCLTNQAKKEISQLISAGSEDRRGLGVKDLALALGVSFSDDTEITALDVLNKFDKRKGDKSELRLALEHMDMREAVSVLDNDTAS